MASSRDTEIQGATDATYTLVPTDEGKTVKVRVSFTDNQGHGEELTSAATATVEAKANSPATGAPAVTGTAQVGETLTADVSAIADDDGLDNVSFSYQWQADGADIAGATNENYTLTHSDEDKAISVRVSFTDHGGNEESLTSAATDAVEARPNSPAAGQPAITGTALVGETLTVDASGIADDDGLDNVSYSYQWISNDGGADSEIGGATGSTYILASGDVGRTIKVRVSFTDDRGHQETLTSAATAVVEAAPLPPLTASLENTPSSHDGENTFTFELRFSEEFSLSYKTLRDHAFTVTGGAVRKAQRLEQGSNIGWRIEVRPNVNDNVTVVLPETGDCDNDGAICTEEGRKQSSRLELTVSGPESQQQQAVQNSPATGALTITGTAQVGETLTADTSGIADTDGLTNVAYSYQWVSNDGNADTDISGATASTCTLVDADEGNTIKVRVAFTDDEGNDETLTSSATAAVAAKPNSPAMGQPTITGTVQVGETLTAVTSDIEDDDGLTNASFSYQWLAGDADISGATGSTYTLADADEGKAVQVRVSFADDAGNEETLTSAATAAVEPVPAPPPAPTNLTAVVNEDGWVTLTWDAPDDDSVTGYLILRRRPHEGEETLLVHVENTGSTATTYTDTNVTSGVRYVYRVKAINSAGVGAQSNYARATP